MNMTALKKIKYPRPDGKEYQPGETFDVANEKHAKAFTLTGIAKITEHAKAAAPMQTQQMTAVDAPASDLPTLRRNRYNRADLRAVDGDAKDIKTPLSDDSA